MTVDVGEPADLIQRDIDAWNGRICGILCPGSCNDAPLYDRSGTRVELAKIVRES
jgi:hypothetical protein